MIIAIDFDGTVVTHSWPEIGQSIGAESVLEDLIKEGHKLILYTMRSGKELQEAVNWFSDRQIDLAGVNVNPWQLTWTQSPKVYANLYIDDAALGIPTRRVITFKEPAEGSNFETVRNVESDRPFVDWWGVRQLLAQGGVLQPLVQTK